jgi:hypothetical protein
METTMNLQEKKMNRFLFLKKIYETTNGERHAGIGVDELAADFKMEIKEAQNIIDYLCEEGLLRRIAMRIVGISHEGVLEVEEALSNPDQATDHFLPFNVINIGQMHNSTLMQGNTNSSLTSITISKTTSGNITELIKMLKKDIDKLGLLAEDQGDLNAEINTMEAQLKSSKPKTNILKECLITTRSILEKAAGGVVAHGIIAHILPILAAL